jgi:hypothetical protein
MQAFRFCVCLAGTALLASAAQGQVIYSWANAGTDWTAAANWNPTGGPPGVNDTALFIAPLSLTVNNPVFNSIATITQTIVGSAPAGGWTLTGTGSLTTGLDGAQNNGIPGVMTQPGSGTFTINVGNGTATSLTLQRSNSPQFGGALNVTTDSTLVLTVDTIIAPNMPLIGCWNSLVSKNIDEFKAAAVVESVSALNLSAAGQIIQAETLEAQTKEPFLGLRFKVCTITDNRICLFQAADRVARRALRRANHPRLRPARPVKHNVPGSGTALGV